MLVLSRKVGEVICIGEHIKIMPVAIRGDKVRLGIEAPREVNIAREELGPYSRPIPETDIGGQG